MILHLFRNHTGMLRDVGLGGHIKTEPHFKGVLKVGKKAYKQGTEGVIVSLDPGLYPMSFVTEDGVKYECGTVRITGGNIYPCNVPDRNVLDLMVRVDNLENFVEELRDQIQKIKAAVTYDSIGFLTEEK